MKTAKPTQTAFENTIGLGPLRRLQLDTLPTEADDTIYLLEV